MRKLRPGVFMQLDARVVSISGSTDRSKENQRWFEAQGEEIQQRTLRSRSQINARH
jgi:hypothetical protein